jgi:hypothetical protein
VHLSRPLPECVGPLSRRAARFAGGGAGPRRGLSSLPAR